MTALSAVYQASKKLLFARIILTAVRAVIPVSLLYIVKLFVDSVVLGVSSPEPDGAFLRSLVLIVAAGTAYAVSFIADSLNEVVTEYHSLKIMDKIYETMHGKSSEIDISFYENPEYHDTLHRAQREAPYRPTVVLNQIFSIFQNLLTFAGTAALILSFSRVAGFVLFAAVVPGTAVHMFFVKKTYKWQKEVTKYERETWYYSFLLTSEGSAKELRLFGIAGLFKERFKNFRKMLRGQLLSIKKKRAASDFAAQTLSSAVLAALLVYLTSETYGGILSLGNLVMFFQAFQRGQGSLRSLLGGFVGLYESGLFLSYFSDFLGLKSRTAVSILPQVVKAECRHRVKIEDVTFSYPGSPDKALKRVNMDFERGRVTAIVGGNGSGKTTVAKLICRFYDPDEGRVIADDTDLRQIEPETWFESVSAVYQDFQKYQLTAGENVWLGDIIRQNDFSSIKEIAEKARIKTVIEKMEKGFDTRLGRWFEGGRELSAGEWQKIAIARCLFKKASVYVFDEPTAYLDALSEESVMEALREAAKEAAVILISHRFSNVVKADYVYVLENGEISEEGLHKELIEKNGIYASSYLYQTGETGKRHE
ncbi:ABC transporter ATP-binding protein [candidate division WOR-3 bacterium]|nr:ABC transporter ATP-binding protein [candidate division WOR-3 bacterium]